MATEIDAARLLTMRAASMKDAGMKTTLESSMLSFTPAKSPCGAPTKAYRSTEVRVYQRLSREKYYRDVKLWTIARAPARFSGW